MTGPDFEGFAQNDLWHEDPTGADHELYKKGLNLALDSYLNKVGFEKNLQDWFEFKIPETTVSDNWVSDFVKI
ncbi:MAG: hypothetical protein ACJAWR_001997 [Flavobacteriales bacterium]